MLRVVLAAIVAVALLGAAMPVVEDARTDRTSQLAESELTRLAEGATRLAATGEAGPDEPARRVVDLSVPEGGFATAPLAYLAVGGVPDCDAPQDTDASDVVAYRLRGGAPTVARVPVDVRVVTAGRLRGDEDPLVLRGDASLTLSLVEHRGDPLVVVGRSSALRVTDGTVPGDSGG